MKTWLVLFMLCWLSHSCWLASFAAPPKSKERPYALGPLKVEEFKGDVEPDGGNKAKTSTRVRYQFEFSFVQFGQQATVTVKSIQLEAVFLPEDSWYGADAPAGLLDHEQGHFDITEIQTRRAELELEEDRRAGKSISGSGNSRQAAHKVVLEKLDQLRQAIDARIAQENVDYDRNTRHGLSFSEQSEIRKIQKLTLASLEEELNELNPRRKARALRRSNVDANTIP